MKRIILTLAIMSSPVLAKETPESLMHKFKDYHEICASNHPLKMMACNAKVNVQDELESMGYCQPNKYQKNQFLFKKCD